MVYQSPVGRVTGDLFGSTISRDRQEHRGAGYRSIPALMLEICYVYGYIFTRPCAALLGKNHAPKSSKCVQKNRTLLIRVTREPSNFRSENCIESKSHDLEIIRFLSNIFKTVVTVYPNRIQNPTFVWRLLYWILIEPENRTIENFSTLISVCWIIF